MIKLGLTEYVSITLRRVAILVLVIASMAEAKGVDYRGLLPKYDNDIRCRAGRILIAIGDRSALPTFIEALEDTDENLRVMAIDALIKFKAAEALPNLVKLLKDSSPAIRIKALEALASLGNKEVIDKVLPLIGDSDETVAFRAKETLKELGYKFLETMPPKIEELSREISEELPLEKPTIERLIFDLKFGKTQAKIQAMKRLGRLKEASAIPILRSHLSSPYSQKVRQEAIRTLLVLEDKNSIPYLIKGLEGAGIKTALDIFEIIMQIDKDASLPIILNQGLKHSNSAVRIAAARCIVRNKIEGGIEGLIGLLGDANLDVKKSACIALGQLRAHQALPQLSRMLSDEKRAIRIVAISTLGKIGDKDALPYLVKRLIEVEEEEYIAILRAITDIGDESSLPYLTGGLYEDAADIRLASVKCLGRLIHNRGILPLVRHALVDPEPDVRLAAKESLKRHNSKTVGKILIDQLDNEDFIIRRRAIQLLGDLSIRPSIPALRKLFEEVDATDKRLIIESIGKIKDPEGVEVVLRALDEEDRCVKEKAIEILSSIIGKESEPHLVKLLADDDIRVRFKAALELAEYGNSSSFEILIWALKDEYIDVRNLAERALLKIKDKSIIPKLLPVFKDEDYRFRYFATMSLNDIYGRKTAIPQIVKDLESRDPWVRYAALKALHHFKDPATRDALRGILGDADSLSRVMAVRTLGTIAERAEDIEVIEALSLGLEDKKAEVRCATVEALGRAKGVEIRDPLIKMLKDSERSVRYAAAFALAQWVVPRTVSILCEALREEDMELRYKAARAFYYTCSKEAIPFLKEALYDESPVVRESVTRALEKWGFR